MKATNNYARLSGSGKVKIATLIRRGWRPGLPTRWFLRRKQIRTLEAGISE